MVLNNKGQAALVGLMVFAMIVLTALFLITPLKDIIVEQRDAGHLDCGNASITFGTKAACLIVDLTPAYFIGTVIIGGASWLFLRKIFSEGGG